jgi:Uma2 family endonuclease
MAPATHGTARATTNKAAREIYRFSVAQYHRMYALFGSEKVEMLEGYIVYRDPERRPPTALPPPLPLTPDIARLPHYSFTVPQYQWLEREGVFGSDRVELLDGYVVRKGPMNPPHAVSLERVGDEFRARLPAGYCLRTEKDVSLTGSQPQPDVAIASGSRGDYAHHHPGPGGLALIVEVADSTLEEDRTTKLRMYARAHIRVYWIVNIPDRRIEVYTQPVAGNNPRYRQRQDFGETESVSFTLGAHTIGPIAVADLLPPS